jgi:hypothetical protein
MEVMAGDHRLGSGGVQVAGSSVDLAQLAMWGQDLILPPAF